MSPRDCDTERIQGEVTQLCLRLISRRVAFDIAKLIFFYRAELAYIWKFALRSPANLSPKMRGFSR